MKWLKRQIYNWVVKPNEASLNTSVSVSNSHEFGSEPMRLNIYRASGGIIIETRTYDRQKDRSQNQLHIIRHEDDLGHSLAKIITMESLRG
jgi:hypothetical protein